MVFITTLMNVDQLYSHLLKLKLNLRIGSNSKYKKKLSMVTTKKAFTWSKKNYFHLLETAPPATRKPNSLAKLFTKKVKSREHSSTHTLPGTAT